MSVEDERASGGKGFGEVAFFVGDGVARVEEFQMGGADIGNDGDFRSDDFGEWSGLAWVIHADFEDPELIGGLGLEEGERDAEVIV